MIGVVVRAGPSPNIAENRICGSPVTAEQTAIGFTCAPPIQRARYVSIEIDFRLTGRSVQLKLSEIAVDASEADDCPINGMTKRQCFIFAQIQKRNDFSDCVPTLCSKIENNQMCCKYSEVNYERVLNILKKIVSEQL